VDLLGSLPRHRNLVSCFTFSPDGQYVVSGCADGHARIVPVADPLTPGAATVKQGRGGWVLSPVTSAVYHPSDPVLITIGGARTAVLWDVSDPKKPLRLADLGRAKPRVGNAFASALSADGNMLVVGAGLNVIGLVSLANVREPRVIAAFFVDKGHANRSAPITRRIDQLAIHPGGQSIAAGTARGTVVVWDTAHTESPGGAVVLEAHQAGISGLAYAPDGSVLATGGHDAGAILWDASDLAQPRVLSKLHGHDDTVRLAFSPVDPVLITGDGRGKIVIWDISIPASPVKIRESQGQRDRVSAIACRRDGRLLAVGYGNGEAELWAI
jgi:WD40 repeat protein